MTISIASIQQAVAAEFALPVAALIGRSRKAHVSRPRHAAMYLAYTITGKSFPVVGYAFGDRDHTTIMHGVLAHAQRMAREPEFVARVDRVRLRLVVGHGELVGART